MPIFQTTNPREFVEPYTEEYDKATKMGGRKIFHVHDETGRYIIGQRKSKTTAPLPACRKPTYFEVGAEDFERWLLDCRAMGNSYACIKHGNTYILLEPHWAACIVNQI